MNHTRTKICGITSVDDALMVAAAGVDAIGLNFYESSPRYVDIQNAALISRAVGPFVSVVGLFVNASTAFVQQVLSSVPLHVLQFHGDEPPEFCEQFKRPYFKVQRINCDANATENDMALVRQQILERQQGYSNSVGFLLDTYSKAGVGGTGETFNWGCVPTPAELSASTTQLILAGGLTPKNVGEAVRMTKPYAVDVSSGVESSPGIKDSTKVKDFIEQARKTSL